MCTRLARAMWHTPRGDKAKCTWHDGEEDFSTLQSTTIDPCKSRQVCHRTEVPIIARPELLIVSLTIAHNGLYQSWCHARDCGHDHGGRRVDINLATPPDSEIGTESGLPRTPIPYSGQDEPTV